MKPGEAYKIAMSARKEKREEYYIAIKNAIENAAKQGYLFVDISDTISVASTEIELKNQGYGIKRLGTSDGFRISWEHCI